MVAAANASVACRGVHGSMRSIQQSLWKLDQTANFGGSNICIGLSYDQDRWFSCCSARNVHVVLEMGDCDKTNCLCVKLSSDQDKVFRRLGEGSVFGFTLGTAVRDTLRAIEDGHLEWH